MLEGHTEYATVGYQKERTHFSFHLTPFVLFVFLTMCTYKGYVYLPVCTEPQPHQSGHRPLLFFFSVRRVYSTVFMAFSLVLTSLAGKAAHKKEKIGPALLSLTLVVSDAH